MKNLLDLLPDTDNLTTKERVEVYKKAFKLSRKGLCKALGITEKELTDIENGKSDVSLESFERFFRENPNFHPDDMLLDEDETEFDKKD